MRKNTPNGGGPCLGPTNDATSSPGTRLARGANERTVKDGSGSQPIKLPVGCLNILCDDGNRLNGQESAAVKVAALLSYENHIRSS
jgi:hypothetical protein